MIANDDLMVMLADLQWWFKFGLSELDTLTLQELDAWLAQAQRQIKAGYQYQSSLG